MNRIEYNNTVRDLLNDATAPASQFPDEEIALGFTNNADAQTVSGLLIEGYESAASALATAATANLPTLLGLRPSDQRRRRVCSAIALGQLNKKKKSMPERTRLRLWSPGHNPKSVGRLAVAAVARGELLQIRNLR